MIEHGSPSASARLPAQVGGFQALKAFQKYPTFRYMWVSSLFSFSAFSMQNLVMSWLAYELTGSAFLLSVFATASMLPMLLGPIGGLIADRVNRVKLLAAIQVIGASLTATLAILATMGLLQYWHLVLVGFLIGVVYSPAYPVRSTLVMDIVGLHDLSNAIALNSIAMYATMVAGPALGGILLGRLGAAPTLWVAALLIAVAVGVLWPILNRVPQREHRNGAPLRDLWNSLRIILRNRTIVAVLFVTMSANLFIWPIIQTFMPVFAKDVLRAGPEGLGFLMTAHGSGALLGSVAIASLRNLTWKGKLYILGTGAFGFLYTLFAFSHWLPVSLVILGLAGIASSGFGVMQATLMLTLSPEEVRGRAMGWLNLAIGVLPLGALLQGAIATAIGVPLTAAIAGALLTVSMIAVFVWVPSLRKLQ